MALYGTPSAWAMTERGRRDIAVTPERFEIGPSQMRWDGAALVIEIDEHCMPGLQPLRGTVRVTPDVRVDHEVILDTKSQHRWRPFAPSARVEVTLRRPTLEWSGRGYFDSNNGDAPLESGFSRWNWSRASIGADTLVLYDAQRRDGTKLTLARIFKTDGTTQDVPAPPPAELKRGLWGVARSTRADAGSTPRLVRALEDAPFYTRSEIAATLLGTQTHGVQESLDLDRFSKRWVQVLLPFRMPRLTRR